MYMAMTRARKLSYDSRTDLGYKTLFDRQVLSVVKYILLYLRLQPFVAAWETAIEANVADAIPRFVVARCLWHKLTSTTRATHADTHTHTDRSSYMYNQTVDTRTRHTI